MKKLHVKKRNGRLEELNVNKINIVVERACSNLEDVSASEIVLDAELQLFDKIPTEEIDKALILTAANKVEKEPNYSYVAARLLLNCIYKEVFGEGVDVDTFDLLYRKSFIQNTKKLIKAGRIDPRLGDFDLKKIADAIQPDRDDNFKYVGIKTFYDAYLIHLDGRRMETPQACWMRVAMGLAINEENKEERAIEFYNALSQFELCSSTPTLFNSGTTHSQLSSCYLNTFDDSVDGIFDGLWQEARKSKFAGGLGFDVTPFRSTGSYIHGTNGSSSGLIPWLKIFNDMLIAVNQGGRRPGSGAAYLEPWHLDVEDFIDLRKETGEERRRAHDLNTALWIPDLFMEAVEADADWYLFDPSEVPTLHDSYGEEFRSEYTKACNLAEEGVFRTFKKIKAKDLAKKILKSIWETSHPWITFKDPSNIRYSNSHCGVVHSSNLCTEIQLHTIASKYSQGIKTSIGETAVCNLLSPNLRTHSKGGKIDFDRLARTIKTGIRMLDNVIDINFYPTEEAKKSNTTHRPIGMGEMGFHDVCHALNIIYDSPAGVELADHLQEFISYHAILTSSELAKEKGKYASYEGSKWSQGKFPIDTYVDLMGIRGQAVCSTDLGTLDWTSVREHVAQYGMRNSNTMAIAPTATISYIQGCEQSIEPNYSVFFVYENARGNFYISNEHFVKDMKKIGVWSPAFAEAVKAVDGDVNQLNIPEKYKEKYKTCFDRDMFYLIDAAAARQKWIDMGQSLNIYNCTPSLKRMLDLSMHAWKKGLKSTYYWRNKAASKVEKSTVPTPTTEAETNPEPTQELPACSIEAMRRGEVCQSCQ